MPATIAEHLDQQLRCAIRYQMMLGKVAGRIHQTDQLDDAPDTVQIAAGCGVQCCEQIPDRQALRAASRPSATVMFLPNCPTQGR